MQTIYVRITKYWTNFMRIRQHTNTIFIRLKFENVDTTDLNYWCAKRVCYHNTRSFHLGIFKNYNYKRYRTQNLDMSILTHILMDMTNIVFVLLIVSNRLYRTQTSLLPKLLRICFLYVWFLFGSEPVPFIYCHLDNVKSCSNCMLCSIIWRARAEITCAAFLKYHHP